MVTDSSPEKAISLFWPLQLFLTVLAATLGYQLFVLNNQRLSDDQAIAGLLPNYRLAVQAENRLNGLLQDLVQTSTQNASAAQIVKEFGIHSNKPSDNSSLKTP